MGIGAISVVELAALRQSGQAVDLIDVRTPGEFKVVRAHGAELLPLDQLTRDRVLDLRKGGGDEPIYLICKSGGRSLLACRQLAGAFAHLVNVTGGTEAWVAAGLPVDRGESHPVQDASAGKGGH